MSRVIHDTTKDLLRRVMTRGDVARYLGKHISTVRRMEGIDLHPMKIGNAFVFESEEVEALGRKLNARVQQTAREGDNAARAFEMFDKNVSFREIVKALKVKPALVQEWYVTWRTPIEEAYANVMSERKARAALKAHRALERAQKADRLQDKHDLQKFKTEMAVLNKSLKGKK